MFFFHWCGCCKDGEALVLSKRLVLLEYGGGLDVWTHSTVGRDSAEKGRRRGGWKYVSVLESQMSNATICLCLWVFACTISYMDLQMHKHTRKHLVREVAKEIVKQKKKKVHHKSWSHTIFFNQNFIHTYKHSQIIESVEFKNQIIQ